MNHMQGRMGGRSRRQEAGVSVPGGDGGATEHSFQGADLRVLGGEPA